MTDELDGPRLFNLCPGWLEPMWTQYSGLELHAQVQTVYPHGGTYTFIDDDAEHPNQYGIYARLHGDDLEDITDCTQGLEDARATLEELGKISGLPTEDFT